MDELEGSGEDVDYLLIGDPKWMYIQILTPKNFSGQSAANIQHEKVIEYNQVRIAFMDFTQKQFQMFEKGNKVFKIDFNDMLGHHTDDQNPNCFHVYRDTEYRWTFHICWTEDFMLMDALLYAAEMKPFEQFRLKNICTYFSTKLLKEGHIQILQKSVAGLSATYQQIYVRLIYGKMLLYKKDNKAPDKAIILRGAKYNTAKDSVDFEIVTKDLKFSFRTESVESKNDWLEMFEAVFEMGEFEFEFDISPSELVTRILHPTLGHTVDELSLSVTGLRTAAEQDMRISSSTSTLSAAFSPSLAASANTNKSSVLKKISSIMSSGFASDAMVEHQGEIVVVQSPKEKWKLLWAVIQEDKLFFYPRDYQNNSELRACVNLQDCTLHPQNEAIPEALLTERPEELKDYTFLISLETFNEQYLLATKTMESQTQWTNAFQSGIRTAVYSGISVDTKTGTVDEFVHDLTNPSQIDIDFTNAFLYTFQSFMTPQELLAKIEQRLFLKYDEEVDKIPKTLWRKMILIPTQQRCVSVLELWMKNVQIDFTDEKLVQSTKELINRLYESNYDWSAKHISIALEKILAKESGTQQTDEEKDSGITRPESKIPRNIKLGVTFIDCDPEEIARQLTLIDMGYYNKIKPVELITQAWGRSKVTSDPSAIASSSSTLPPPVSSNSIQSGLGTGLPDSAINDSVVNFIIHFNRVSLYIANSIVAKERLKERAFTMAKAIQVCGHLYQIKNFNSLKACLAGLNMAPCYRLKHTKSILSPKILLLRSDLEKKMAPDKAHKQYRAILSSSSPPCIPFMGVHLTDLTFVGDGNNDMIGDKHNFTKRKLAYDIVKSFTQFQGFDYNFSPVPELQSMINNAKLFQENELFDLSMQNEPRNVKKQDLLQ